jgi:hypothetical protein
MQITNAWAWTASLLHSVDLTKRTCLIKNFTAILQQLYAKKSHHNFFKKNRFVKRK